MSVALPQDCPFPEVVDSTILATARSCGHKVWRMYLQDWKPKTESVHLHAGKAFAHGLEVARRTYYELGHDADYSVAAGIAALSADYGTFECPDDSAKSAERMMGALEFYFSRWPLDSDKASPINRGGQLGIEFSFAEPLPYAHPVTGEPILYSGRADMIADFAGSVYVFDEKTTSSLGNSWHRQWDLRSQFTGYCWAAGLAGIPVSGVVVRGVSILKTKYDAAEAITSRAKWEVDRWLDQVVEDLAQLERQWRSGRWNFNLDHACTEYGGCVLREVCKVADPEVWLPMYFERRHWDPLTREETLLHHD